MAEEVYAKDAAMKDERVQKMAYEDSDLTEKSYIESAKLVPEFSVKEGAKVDDLSEDEKATLRAEKFKYQELEDVVTIKEEAKAIEEDGARSADDKAAAEIIKEIADREEKEILAKKTLKARFKQSRELFNNSLRLIKVSPGAKLTAKMLRVKENEKYVNTFNEDRGFSGGSFSFGDSLRRAKAGAKELTAPTKGVVKNYDEL